MAICCCPSRVNRVSASRQLTAYRFEGDRRLYAWKVTTQACKDKLVPTARFSRSHAFLRSARAHLSIRSRISSIIAGSALAGALSTHETCWLVSLETSLSLLT